MTGHDRFFSAISWSHGIFLILSDIAKEVGDSQDQFTIDAAINNGHVYRTFIAS